LPKVSPLARVIADFLKHANPGFSTAYFNKVGSIAAHEGDCGLDTTHPHIIEDDVAADCAKRSVQVEVYEHIIEAMVAVDENNFKSAIGSREISGNPIRTIFNKSKSGIRALGGSDGLGMPQANAVRERTLKRIDGGMVANLTLGNGCQKVQCAETVRHADLDRRFGSH